MGLIGNTHTAAGTVEDRIAFAVLEVTKLHSCTDTHRLGAISGYAISGLRDFKTRQAMCYDVTLRRVRATIVAVEE